MADTLAAALHAWADQMDAEARAEGFGGGNAYARELRERMAAVLSSPSPVPAGTSERNLAGWNFKKHNDGAIGAWKEGVGGIMAWPEADTIAEAILWELVNDCAALSLSPAAGQQTAEPAPSAEGPAELWLQLHGDCDDVELSEPVDYTGGDVTWCWHQINNSDVRYVRADLASPAPAGAAGEREALKLARPYVESAAERMYDGTGGTDIRAEAKRRLAVIDAALSLSEQRAEKTSEGTRR